MIFNWYHTGVNYIPVCPCTLEKEGMEKVGIIGMNANFTVVLSLAKACFFILHFCAPSGLVVSGVVCFLIVSL